MHKPRGRFIVFEGLDGSGKSTQLSLFANGLRLRNIKVYETFEPTDSPIGSLIHQIMTGRIKCDQKAIAALFVADRLDHLLNEVNGISDKINNGIFVLSDRYYFSSYAYHSIHIPIEWIIQANSLSAEILRPDLTIYLNVSPEKCVARLGKERHHFELYENIESLTKVHDKYFESFDFLKKNEEVLIVDGDGDQNHISAKIWELVNNRLHLM